MAFNYYDYMIFTIVFIQNNKNMTKEEIEKRRQETLRKMRVYNLHASEVDILEEAGEL